MLKTLITFAILYTAFLWSTDAINLTKIVKNSGQTSSNEIPIVSSDCNSKLPKLKDICNQTVSDSWKKSNISQLIAKEALDGHSDKMNDLVQTMECCIAVEMIECQNNQVKSLCNEEDYNQMHNIYEKAKQTVEDLICKTKAYNPIECHKYVN